MNALKVFMGCMYPGSIRTESIESMDHDHPGYQFEVSISVKQNKNVQIILNTNTSSLDIR